MKIATRRTFDVRPDFREAVLLSAFLWCGVLGFLNLSAIIGGTVSTLGEYITIILAPIFALAIALVLFAAFRFGAGRNVLIAWPLIGLAAVSAAVLMTGADYGSQYALHKLFAGHRMPTVDRNSVMVIAALYLCIYTTNAALLWITSANRHMREQQHQIAVRDADNLRAQLRALRLQLDPHFTFNALNGVCSLMTAGRHDDAERMVHSLAGFIRATQDYLPDTNISLADELGLTEEYLEVEAVRFGDLMRVDVRCDPDLSGVLVPNLMLQPLVENAVKYGVSQSAQPVTVSIRAQADGVDRVRITVANDGAPVVSAAAGSGLGESSTRTRLEMFYGADATFDAGPTADGYRVEITLPRGSSDPASATVGERLGVQAA